jgi:hypothetical protein
LIYVAGKLSAPTPEERLANVERACRVARQILDRGHYCIIPHLTEHFDRLEWDRPLSYSEYMAWDNVILCRCDALYYDSSSPGADQERTAAHCMGMPVYLSVDDLPDVKKEGREDCPPCNEASTGLPVGAAQASERDRHSGDPWWRWSNLREYHSQRRASSTAAAASDSSQAAAACDGCGLPLAASEREKLAPLYDQTMWECETCGQTAWGAADFGGVG